MEKAPQSTQVTLENISYGACHNQPVVAAFNNKGNYFPGLLS